MPRFPAGYELAEALTAAAQQLHDTVTSHSTMHTAVHLAVRLLPGADHAGISVIEGTHHRRTVAWTDEVVRSAEAGHTRPTGPTRPTRLTGSTGSTGSTGQEQAPYWEHLWTTPVVRLEDSEADDGGAVLYHLGLRSALSLRLRADRRRLTVLTAYSRKPRAFDEAATRVGRLFTAHVSLALDSATVREQLTEAMRTRDLIGQATGILMERMDMDAAEAFESLVKASQRENIKLRDLARRILDAHGAA
ncbi:ANTAR domain-containing protein [Streptomyces sp. LBL]|uniref:ANTAR domain-containing protein n=1 Tax=Streptomyces sp. LBL TaxID=2940562 RepID=UPI002475BDB9|nr:ANTAR domain-containing protein [Streptomyces sp. LBL]